MASTLLDNLASIREQAARIKLPFADDSDPTAPTIVCFDQQLPAEFVWLCSRFRGHSGWPYGLGDDYGGIRSPFGEPSPLEQWNRTMREDPRWPSKWISFCHTGDGEYAFSYEDDGRVGIVYHVHWETGDPVPVFDEKLQAADFVDWFTQQVDWLVKIAK